MSVFAGPEISTDGLVLHLDAGSKKSYPGSGTIWYNLTDSSNNGTLTNNPTFNSENGGTIVFSNASSSYVTLGNDKYKYQDNFTVEIIAKFPNMPNNPGAQCGARHPIVYNHDYGYNLMINSLGLLEWQLYNLSTANKSITSSISGVGNTYFHAVATKSNTTINLHHNGMFQNTATLTSNAVYYISQPFTIGGYGLCGSNRFYATGNIPLVKVYNRALSANEVKQNFNALRGRFGI